MWAMQRNSIGAMPPCCFSNNKVRLQPRPSLGGRILLRRLLYRWILLWRLLYRWILLWVLRRRLLPPLLLRIGGILLRLWRVLLLLCFLIRRILLRLWRVLRRWWWILPGLCLWRHCSCCWLCRPHSKDSSNYDSESTKQVQPVPETQANAHKGAQRDAIIADVIDIDG